MIRSALLVGAPRLSAEGGVASRLLHPRELASLSPNAVPKRRDDFVRGRLVARRLVVSTLAVRLEALAIVPDEHGVPWAEHEDLGRLPWSVSISHTEGVAAAATVSLPRRIGIDVERPIARPGEIIGDYFADRERRLCEGLDVAGESWRAAEIWAVKEACLKALGIGLRVPTTAVVVHAIASEESDAGWYSVTVAVDRALPVGGASMRAWARRQEGVAVALAVLGSDSALAPGEPGTPDRYLVDAS